MIACKEELEMPDCEPPKYKTALVLKPPLMHEKKKMGVASINRKGKSKKIKH